MKIATILFTYNRSWHTKQVLDALMENTRIPDKLYIFQDGLREENHRMEWEKVNLLIKTIDFCDCEVIVSDRNKGLADSIIFGVNYAFQKYDAVIVLEDDCVPHRLFMEYMFASLNKYEKESQVFSVSAYTNPVEVEKNGTDAYFTRRAESLGWGTWKDKWEKHFQVDYRIFARMKKNPELLEQYRIWGGDLLETVHGNVDGRCNSWAVFWALKTIEDQGYCLAPYESLVNNIGFDGTGVHSSDAEFVQIVRAKENMTPLVLPDEIRFPDQYEKTFGNFFWKPAISTTQRLQIYNSILVKWVEKGDHHILQYFQEKKIKSVAIWGKGNLCRLLIGKINEVVHIKCIVTSLPESGEVYEGVKVYDINSIPEVDLMIVIPIYDFEEIVSKNHLTNAIGIDDLIG